MPNRDMIVWPTKMSDFHRQSEFETIVNAVYVFIVFSLRTTLEQPLVETTSDEKTSTASILFLMESLM
jgi:hypothetical protein